MKYGLMMGRFQPFHFGHQHIVNEIMLDGLTPIIMIGSINKDRDLTKNPLSLAQRIDTIRMIYPNPSDVLITGAEDSKDWNKWFNNVLDAIKDVIPDFKIEDLTLYFHNKETDIIDSFTIDNKEFKNCFYTEVFKYKGFKMKPIEFVNRSDFKIDSNARDIRADIEGFRHFLDARIYKYLKTMGW